MSIICPPPAIVGYDSITRIPHTRAVRSLTDRISEAIAWGMPDKESTGFSQSELISLLVEARNRIRELESK